MTATEGLNVGFLSINDAATFFGVTRNTMRSWIRYGRLKTIKIGKRRLIATGEIKRLIAAGEALAAEKGECKIKQ